MANRVLKLFFVNFFRHLVRCICGLYPTWDAQRRSHRQLLAMIGVMCLRHTYNTLQDVDVIGCIWSVFSWHFQNVEKTSPIASEGFMSCRFLRARWSQIVLENTLVCVSRLGIICFSSEIHFLACCQEKTYFKR